MLREIVLQAVDRVVTPIDEALLVGFSNTPHKVMLEDDSQYPIKGMGEASYKLDFIKFMKMKYVLYVPRLKNNLMSISALDQKGFTVSFVDGKVLMWSKGKTIDDAVEIGV